MEQTEANLDPKLRSAIKRVRGRHVASPALRAQIEQALQEPATRPLRRPMNWTQRLAIAACLLLAGMVVEHIRHKFEEQTKYMAANTALLEAMPKAHDAPLPGDAQAVADISNPARVRDELSQRLSRKTPTPDLRPVNWSLTAAAITPFRGAIAARFEFVQNSRRATLFSLPKFAFVGAETGGTYDITVAGHPITGYITEDGVHCIVGDKSMPMDELVALRKRLQQS
jgi:hypothetical protein